MNEHIPFHNKYYNDKVVSCHTTGDNIIKESWSLPVGIGVELYT